MTTHERITYHSRQLEQAKNERLVAAGWSYTCRTPGCFWLWEKILEDGRTLLVEEQFAHTIQDHLDADREVFTDNSNSRE